MEGINEWNRLYIITKGTRHIRRECGHIRICPRAFIQKAGFLLRECLRQPSWAPAPAAFTAGYRRDDMPGELAAAGVQIISGLATGVDAAAHEGALEGGGVTFAVLGCGVDICYPKENYPLMRRMLEHGGGILSEFEPGEEPAAWHFPQRTGWISALADLVLVVEARKRSGSLITADYALERGKVFTLFRGE